MFPLTPLKRDFWRVSSYGYPCFFNDNAKSQEAWETLLSFFDFNQYDKLKKYWTTTKPSRALSPHAVESWKATFEEFGFLYVPTNSNQILITPAGMQLRNAADQNNRDEFAWIGLNLLMRYPLRGPRRSKSDAHSTSDLLLYRFLFAILLDLGGSIWWSEFERILCRVFQTELGEGALLDILALRENPALLSEVSLPVENKAGGFYNSLNQIMVHAGMNHLLLGTDDSESPYGITEPKRRNYIKSQWVGMIRKALISESSTDQCSNKGMAILRVPNAPSFLDELSYFEYLGAKVNPMDQVSTTDLQSIELLGDKVFYLKEGIHYSISEESKSIIGDINNLCQIARGQRLILSHDEQWTYIVINKELINPSIVKIALRQAKPLTSIEALKELLGENYV